MSTSIAHATVPAPRYDDAAVDHVNLRSRMKQQRDKTTSIVVHADVPMAVFDEFRHVIVLPMGLDAAGRVKALTELYEERRGGWSS